MAQARLLGKMEGDRRAVICTPVRPEQGQGGENDLSAKHPERLRFQVQALHQQAATVNPAPKDDASTPGRAKVVDRTGFYPITGKSKGKEFRI